MVLHSNTGCLSLMHVLQNKARHPAVASSRLCLLTARSTRGTLLTLQLHASRCQKQVSMDLQKLCR